MNKINLYDFRLKVTGGRNHNHLLHGREPGNLEFFPILYIIISVTGIFVSRYNLIIMLLALDMIIFSISLLFIYLLPFNQVALYIVAKPPSPIFSIFVKLL